MIAQEVSAEVNLETDNVCADCSKSICLLEEAVLIQVVYPSSRTGQVELHPVLSETGGYLYEPYLFHQNCWFNVIDQLREERRDIPPIPDLQGLSICKCFDCKSDVREGEVSGVAIWGDLRRSPRSPNGMNAIYFQATKAPHLMCISCMLCINDGVIELWENGISQNDECSDGTHGRCWRDNGCNGGCKLE